MGHQKKQGEAKIQINGGTERLFNVVTHELSHFIFERRGRGQGCHFHTKRFFRIMAGLGGDVLSDLNYKPRGVRAYCQSVGIELPKKKVMNVTVRHNGKSYEIDCVAGSFKTEFRMHLDNYCQALETLRVIKYDYRRQYSVKVEWQCEEGLNLGVKQ